MGLMGVDELLDGRVELRNTPERATTDPFVRQLGEPALDETQPRTVGGREVDMKARTFGEPVPDERCFMGTVVIHDDVHVKAARYPDVKQIQKFPELRRAMALMKLRDHV